MHSPLEGKYFILLCKGIEDYLADKRFSDITLQIEGKRFPCHKLLLSVISPYFSAMFSSNMKEAKKKIIQLPFLTVSTFELLQHFIYTGKNKSTADEALELLEAASFLQIGILQEDCENIIKANIHNMNILEVWRIGKKLSKSLETTAFTFICRYFKELVARKELMNAEKEELSEILKSPELILLNEDIASELIVSWLENDFDTRKQSMDEVLPLLRLPFASGDYLFERIEKECPTVCNDEKFLPYLIEAQNYYKFPTRRGDFACNSTMQRPSSQFSDVIIFFDKCKGMLALTAESLAWHTLGPLFRDKGEHFAACTTGDSSICILGGTKDSSSFLKYSGLTNRWNSYNSLRLDPGSCMTNHTVIGFGDTVYSFGGEVKKWRSEAQPCMQLLLFTYLEQTLNTRPAGILVYPVYDASAVISKGKIIIVGKNGKNASDSKTGNVTVIQCYDTVTEFTTVINCVDNVHGIQSVFSFDDDLYAITKLKVCKLNAEFQSSEELIEVPSSMTPYGMKKISNKILLFGNNTDANEIEKICFVGFDMSSKQPVSLNSLDRNFTNLQRLCLKIIVRKCFLKPDVNLS